MGKNNENEDGSAVGREEGEAAGVTGGDETGVTASDLAVELGLDPAAFGEQGAKKEHAKAEAAAEGGDEKPDGAAGDDPEAESADGEGEKESAEKEGKAAEKKVEEKKPRDKVQERIDELVARAKGAEEREAALAKRLEALETSRKGTREEERRGPRKLEELDTEEEVEAHVKGLQDRESWLMENLDGYESEPDAQGRVTSYDAKTIRRALEGVRLELADAPKRAEWARSRAKHLPAVLKAYPELNDPESEMGKVKAQLLKQVPEVARRMPVWELNVALMVEGLRAVRAREAAAALGKKKEEGAGKDGTSHAAPGGKSGTPRGGEASVQKPAGAKGRRLAEAEEKYNRTGSQEDLEALLEARLG